jgi:hypothetical protein
VLRTVAASALIAVALSGTPTVGAAGPPGGTAVCRDGTYSFSQHRSGTCSRHGGVATWLTRAGGSSASIAVGETVLLAPRTRTSGCTLGANPDRACSPGAYSSRITTAVLCSPGFHTALIRNVPDSERFVVEREYGLTPGHYGDSLEIDHIVALELGGSNDAANLYPERADAHPGYHVKDRLENRLLALVCAGAVELRDAQRRIATNWQALYQAVFGVAPAG